MGDVLSRIPGGFAWATGIEDTFIHQARPGLRALDEYQLTQHYQFWKEDLDRVADSGIPFLRWGVPWHKVQPTPDRWDWEWTDQVLDYMVNNRGITPILDLMHYGTPAWIDNSFINASYPRRVAEFTRAVVSRYKSIVHFYTPFNEPMVNVEWAGQRADWPPYLEGHDGAVKLTLAIARGIQQIVKSIKEEQPSAITVQVEALWRYSASTPSIEEQIKIRNLRQYLCFDLTTGRVNDEHILYSYLREHGVAERDLEELNRDAVSYDIFGANFYPWSYSRVYLRSSGLMNRLTHNISGHRIADVLEDAYNHYQMPVMITETSALRDLAGREAWMDETIAAVSGLRQKGIPIIGYTWFPFFSMISWYYRRGRRPMQDYLLHLGLYDANFDDQGILQRRRTPLVDRYQQYMQTPLTDIGFPVNAPAASEQPERGL
jgi:beta-glucosidase